MQVDGNTMVSTKANFAIAGKFDCDASAMMGRDFMAILKDMSALQSERNLKDFNQREPQKDFAVKKDGSQLRQDESYKDSLKEDERTDTKKDSNREDATTVSLLGDPSKNEFVTVSCESNLIDTLSDDGIQVTTDEAFSMPHDFLDTSAQTIRPDGLKEDKTLMEKAVSAQSFVKMMPDAKGDTVFADSEVSGKNGSDNVFMGLNDSDDATLKEAIASLSKMSTSDFKELSKSDVIKPDTLSDSLFSKTQKEQGSTALLGSSPLQSAKETLNNTDIKVMLSELNGSYEVKGDTKLMDVAKNLGAREFANIEKSLMQSLNMQTESLEAKLNTLTENKMLGREESLMRSMQVLKEAASGMNSANALSLNPEALTKMQSKEGLLSDRGNLALGMREALRGVSAFTAPVLEQHMGQDSSFNQQGGAEQNLYAKFSNQVLLKGEMRFGTPEGQSASSFLTLSQNLRENAEALTKKVMEMASRNLKNMEITLNPEGLGKIKISIDATSQDEITKISIGATLSNTRALLENGLGSLKEVLNNHDIVCETTVEQYESEEESHEEFSDNHSEQGQDKGQKQEREEREDTVFAGSATASEEVATASDSSIEENADGSISTFA